MCLPPAAWCVCGVVCVVCGVCVVCVVCVCVCVDESVAGSCCTQWLAGPLNIGIYEILEFHSTIMRFNICSGLHSSRSPDPILCYTVLMECQDYVGGGGGGGRRRGEEGWLSGGEEEGGGGRVVRGGGRRGEEGGLSGGGGEGGLSGGGGEEGGLSGGAVTKVILVILVKGQFCGFDRINLAN